MTVRYVVHLESPYVNVGWHREERIQKWDI